MEKTVYDAVTPSPRLHGAPHLVVKAKFHLSARCRRCFLCVVSKSPMWKGGNTTKFIHHEFQDGKKLEENDDILFLNERQQLHIEGASTDHAGRYTCLAENKPGRAEKDLVVAVLRECHNMRRAFYNEHRFYPSSDDNASPRCRVTRRRRCARERKRAHLMVLKRSLNALGVCVPPP